MKFYTALLILLVTTLLLGCGGGSEGTGTRTLAGVVLTTTSQPIAQAKVTVLETGDAAVTDATGNFTIQTDSTEGPLTIEVATDSLRVETSVPSIEKEATSVSVQITVDTNNATASITDIHIWARMVGACDAYFENRAIIRQSVRVPTDGIRCTIKFFASGGGKRLERIPGAVQVRSCNSSQWRTLAEGKTGFGINAGAGSIEFLFIDNERNCEYRVAAPFEVEGVEPLSVLISTFTLQGK